MKIKCHLCDKILFDITDDFKGEVYCPDCVVDLDNDEKKFYSRIGKQKEEIKKLKQMITDRVHWSDLEIDNP